MAEGDEPFAASAAAEALPFWSGEDMSIEKKLLLG